MIYPDHRLVRRSFTCPCCEGPKLGGRVACSNCWYDIWTAGSQQQIDEAEDKLDEAEDALQAQEDAEEAA